MHVRLGLILDVEYGCKGLFVWAVAGWLCRESCCAEKAAVQGKLLF
jgi:hypothetical protein